MTDHKAKLHEYLTTARNDLRHKTEGLSEYDVRRPLVPTGTNLLGLLKHTALVAAGYFGDTFGRPFSPTFDSTDPQDDMYATAEESRDEILDLYDRAWEHADATIEALDADATGHVPWWGPGNEVTLHQIMTHVLAEVSRHSGHADIVRELIDGQVGRRAPGDGVHGADEAWWTRFRARLEQIARDADQPA